MKIQVVTSNKLIINTQGLRFAESIESDRRYEGDKPPYRIRLCYRKEEFSHYFADKIERDRVFEELKMILSEAYGKK